MLELLKKIDRSFDFESELGKYCDEVISTPTGDLVGAVRGSCEGVPETVVATHVDMPFFLCTEVTSDGKACVSPIGGVTPSACVWCDAVSDKGVRGVLVPFEGEKYKVDLGCDGKSAARRVAVGDRFYPYRPVRRLCGSKAVGFGLQVSAPCAVLLTLAERLSAERPRGDVYLTFTRNGQFDCKQYSAAVSAVGAPLAVCVGYCDSAMSQVKLGGGAAVRLCDKSFSSDKVLADRLIECGGIPTVLSDTSCAASRVQLGGVPAAQLDIPLDYYGTPSECVDISDIKSARDILAKLL